jgi:hypothetical protein
LLELQGTELSTPDWMSQSDLLEIELEDSGYSVGRENLATSFGTAHQYADTTIGE